MRSRASIFVTCDDCDREREVLLDCDEPFEKQVDEVLIEYGWEVEVGDICGECLLKMEEQI